jgi:hypothetical protein
MVPPLLLEFIDRKTKIIMHFSNESEAILAMVSLALSADEIGTSQERSYLFDHISRIKPFKDLDRQAYNAMIATVNDQLFGTTEGFARLMQADGILDFCSSVKAVISTDRIESAFQIACETACSDELVPVETRMLQALGIGLGLSQSRISDILMNAERMCAVGRNG